MFIFPSLPFFNYYLTWCTTNTLTSSSHVLHSMMSHVSSPFFFLLPLGNINTVKTLKLLNTWVECIHKVTNLQVIKIRIVPVSIELKKASIGTIPYTNKKRLCVGAKRYTRDLSKKIDLLLLFKSLLCIIDMHKVSWLGHCHIPSIRCEAYWAYSSKVSLKNSNRLW